VDLRYNLERELLGTAGGASAFRDFLGNGTFVVVSGDGLTDIDLTAFVAAHRQSGGIASLAVKQVGDPSLYGVVVHDDAGRITGFQEKPAAAVALSDLCNCGIYAFEPEIFDFLPAGVFVDWARDVFPALLAAGAPFYCWRLESYWNDVGNIEQYRLSNFDALLGRVAVDVPGRQIRPQVWIGEGTQIDPDAHLEAPVLIGAGCSVESHAELIGPLIVGDGCVIEQGAVLEGTINWDGVKAGRGCHLAGSILGRNVVVHHEAVVREDAVIGDRSEVAAHALVSPGSRVEPRSAVDSAGVAHEPELT
jgi:NDP-sugar pyrophosphorylase family protein